jgi:UDP-N-acetylglucosamine 4-epimerase
LKGKNIKPIFGPERKGDIRHSNADINKAKEMLEYDPDWSFQQGIIEVIDWYKENL